MMRSAAPTLRKVTLYKNDLALLELGTEQSSCELPVDKACRELALHTLAVRTANGGSGATITFQDDRHAASTGPSDGTMSAFDCGASTGLGAFLASVVGAAVVVTYTSTEAGGGSAEAEADASVSGREVVCSEWLFAWCEPVPWGGLSEPQRPCLGLLEAEHPLEISGRDDLCHCAVRHSRNVAVCNV